jgi:spermidine/putrescine transport system substrate-binding protein
MLSEMRDTVGSVLLADGVEPEKASLDEVMKAIDKIESAARSGQIRRFTGNDYVRDLLKGDSYAILGWSGDAVSAFASNPNVKYKHPEHEFMIFTDTMQIPVGAPHAFTAQKFMDYVYRPEVQANLTIAINYVPPVKGTKEVLLEKEPELAESDLIFPDLSKAHNFKSFPPEEEADIELAFQRAIGV